MGDNLTGAGEGDDEQIFVDLQNVPLEVGTIVFAVNIYDAFKRNQHFGMIRNAFIRVVDYEHNVELCRFELSENYYNMTALVAGALIGSSSSGSVLRRKRLPFRKFIRRPHFPRKAPHPRFP